MDLKSHPFSFRQLIWLPGKTPSSILLLSFRKWNPKTSTSLTSTFYFKEEKKWAPKGFEVAANQFSLSAIPETSSKKQNFPSLKLSENEQVILVEGNNFGVNFSKENGALISYKKDTIEQIYSPLLPQFTRPLTDNDKSGWKPQCILKEWYQAKPEIQNMEVQKIESGLIRVKSIYNVINEKAQVEVIYLVNGNGVVKSYVPFNHEYGVTQYSKSGAKLRN